MVENFSAEEIIQKIRDTHNNSLNLLYLKDLLGDDVHHFSVSYNGLFGFGTAKSLCLAIEKAYSEYCERVEFITTASNDTSIATSSGFAAHLSKESAQNNAISELLERDAFLCIWYLKHPPFWLNNEQLINLGLDSVLLEIDRFFSYGFQLKVGIIGISFNRYCVLSAMTPIGKLQNMFGGVLETAAGVNLNDAFDSVIRTQRRSASMILNRINSYCCVWEIVNINDMQPRDHLEYYLNPLNYSSLKWLIEGNSTDIIKFPDVEIKTVQAKNHMNTAIDLFILRAYSNEVQNYYSGKFQSSYVNMYRLKNVFKTFSELNYEIHPLS